MITLLYHSFLLSVITLLSGNGETMKQSNLRTFSAYIRTIVIAAVTVIVIVIVIAIAISIALAIGIAIAIAIKITIAIAIAQWSEVVSY